MKKLLCMGMLALATCAFAKEATIVNERVNARAGCMRDWTPFALTVFGPVGLPWGDWNVSGLQIGLVNSVYELSGLQIGVINVADRARGFQIGLVNVISTDDCAFLPIVNWSF